MPNIKSAKKRVDVAAKNKQINKAYKSELATGLKKFNAFIGAADVKGAEGFLPEIVKLLDKSVTRGIIHKNKADRKKAELGTKLVKLQAAPAKKEEVKKEEVKVVAEEEVKAPAKKRATKKTAEAEEPKKTTRKTAKKDAE
ncbi:MAG: 30S ribosomal protein S20 [Clostridia bacterium]|nr:30S ribosomal protein S20 [Clostridia bacterium]